jgi:uncharacterized RDD family membrane protein YckC
VRSGATTCANCGYPLTLAPTVQATSATRLLADNTQIFSGIAPVIYAGFWRRFAAAIIDGVLLFVLLGGLDFIAGLAVGFTGAAFSSISSALSFGVGIAYYVGLESSSQQATFGKRALGIIVTDLQGNRISPWRAAGRYFGKILSALTLLIGYLMAGFTAKKQALHDIMASTLVVVKPTSR